jgi:hypothetical protein
MSLDEFEASLRTHATDPALADRVKHDVLSRVGSRLFWDKDLDSDIRLYRLAIQHGRWNPRLWAKYGVLRLGPLGTAVMRAVALVRASDRRPLTKEAS